ncbi:nucleocapsid protein [Rodent paramyxovirus]|uniref:Nucleocapsid n=1 Tax=Rodent paramyxovirus TaxID=1497434 RepID=A0AAD0EXL2_9MONO|nr:nucleocapsid protein [Rodent paramyxovirus]ATP66846.1 nucleocapsid protein [Rodent paramyxovirus]
MSRLGAVLDDFRSHRNNPPKRGILSTALQGLKKNVVVPVPMMKDPAGRFLFMTFCLQLVWSERASGAFITGAFISLLSIFAENPGAMIRSLINDPDIDVQLAEVAEITNDRIHLVTRGRGMEKYENEMMRMASATPISGKNVHPFVVKDFERLIPKSTEDLQISIQTVSAQIWVLLSKAVTAIDTAKESENRRWVKYAQQRRADEEYRLNDTWLNIARNRVASDLAIRRYMVEVLIDAGKAAPPKARILELICDIGNYISEAGLAGLFLTIKYGIETKYPALALNELQADLATVLSLMKCYISLGERGPFMVILEDSIQTKFSPGSYPLLWSYAMGVGSMLDRAVNNLNYSRNYLEQSFYNLGVSMVERMEGSVNKQIAEELGLTKEQIDQVKEIVKREADITGSNQKQGPKNNPVQGAFQPEPTDEIIPAEDVPAVLIHNYEPRYSNYESDDLDKVEKAARSKPAPIIPGRRAPAPKVDLSKMKADLNNFLKEIDKKREVPGSKHTDSEYDSSGDERPAPNTDLAALDA